MNRSYFCSENSPIRFSYFRKDMRFNLIVLLLVFQTTNEEEFHPDNIQIDGFQVSGFKSLVCDIMLLETLFTNIHAFH